MNENYVNKAKRYHAYLIFVQTQANIVRIYFSHQHQEYAIIDADGIGDENILDLNR